MSGPLTAILAIVIPGTVSLTVAFFLLRRGHVGWSVMAGIGVIVAAQAFLQGRLQVDIQACVERACRFIDDPAACEAATFGCSEWTGLASLAYLIAGVLDVLLLLVAYAVARFMARKRPRPGISA
jgi:predicted Na+-dependent transporter